MQITDSGVTTVTNVENSDSSVLCKSSDNVPDSIGKLSEDMAETANSDSGADTASEAAMSKESFEVNKSEVPKPCTENLEVEIDNIRTKPNGIEENTVDVLNTNGGELGILEQADTTSVENLSIVTVVEKELETANEIIPNNIHQDYVHPNG